MTAFKVNQTVRSTIDGQRMKRGETFSVLDVVQRPTPFGNFFTYVLQNDRTPRGGIEVSNGHMILDLVGGDL